nr:MAG TPA: hypothetical protein [Caudoviricetes sp.]DAR08686.1 MAG TPA: hypothetical protein [Caudoviricetes sp.]DAW01995.1 MAG TPA: hypothetical protein [Caudoviricetes sp.]
MRYYLEWINLMVLFIAENCRCIKVTFGGIMIYFPLMMVAIRQLIKHSILLLLLSLPLILFCLGIILFWAY